MKVNYFRNLKEEMTRNYNVFIGIPLLIMSIVIGKYSGSEDIAIFGSILAIFLMFFLAYGYRIYNNAHIQLTNNYIEIKVKTDVITWEWNSIKKMSFYVEEPQLKAIIVAIEFKDSSKKNEGIIMIDRYKFESSKKRYLQFIDELKKLNSSDFRAVEINYEIIKDMYYKDVVIYNSKFLPAQE